VVVFSPFTIQCHILNNGQVVPLPQAEAEILYADLLFCVHILNISLLDLYQVMVMLPPVNKTESGCQSQDSNLGG
jgi:hypothetical protein